MQSRLCDRLLAKMKENNLTADHFYVKKHNGMQTGDVAFDVVGFKEVDDAKEWRYAVLISIDGKEAIITVECDAPLVVPNDVVCMYLNKLNKESISCTYTYDKPSRTLRAKSFAPRLSDSEDVLVGEIATVILEAKPRLASIKSVDSLPSN